MVLVPLIILVIYISIKIILVGTKLKVIKHIKLMVIQHIKLIALHIMAFRSRYIKVNRQSSTIIQAISNTMEPIYTKPQVRRIPAKQTPITHIKVIE